MSEPVSLLEVQRAAVTEELRTLRLALSHLTLPDSRARVERRITALERRALELALAD